MADLLANRINETMSDAQITQAQTGISAIVAALPVKPIMPDDEYNRIAKKAEIREKEADQMLPIVLKYPKFAPSTLTVEAPQKDNTLYNQLKAFKRDYLTPLVNLVDFLMGISGGEEINFYSRFTENVKIGVKDKDPDAIAAQNEIDAIERHKGGGSAAKRAPKPPKAPKSPKA